MGNGISWLRVGSCEHNNGPVVKVLQQTENIFFSRMSFSTVRRPAAFALVPVDSYLLKFILHIHKCF